MQMQSLFPIRRRFACAFFTCLVMSAGAAFAQDAADIEFFEAKIRPVLSGHCYECHNSHGTVEGGLIVDQRDALRKGGDNGPVIVPGKPAESTLLSVLRHEIKGREMPQGGAKLSAAVIADFETWIRRGAADPRTGPPSAADHAAASAWPAVFEQRRKWWSFQPILSPEVPAQLTAAAQNPAIASEHPIDLFIRSKLAEQGLDPGRSAEDSVLIRRQYFTIVGLPPSVPDLQRWTELLNAAGSNPRSRDAVVGQLADELLARPQFGERWARHWMDWIRYADSHGSEGDPTIDNAWQYRDYLIRALNSDVPYDQLVREHVAGDLLSSPRLSADRRFNESAIGPAHWRMVFHGFAPTDAMEERVRFTDDQVNTFTKAFLGLTVSCARCHDHKFDAISQKDYYALFGILTSCRPARTVIDQPTEQEHASRQRLSVLKNEIRRVVATSWLKRVEALKQTLLADSGPWQTADKPTSVLHDWHLLHKLAPADEQFSGWWQQTLAEWDKQRHPADFASGSHVVHGWNFAQPGEVSQWLRSGNGLAAGPSTAGEFVIAINGDRIIDRLLPAGLYSNLLSAKDAARLESPDFIVDDNYDVWLQMIGDGSAMNRYVVQNYPRNGTVYPVPKIGQDWYWQRFDVGYWQGDRVHLELATAKDAPLLVENKDRSWFGIRRAIVVRKDQPQPHHAVREHVDEFFETAIRRKPTNSRELADCFEQTLITAIIAWRNRTSTDAQALFLQQCLREGLLANSPETIPDAAALLQEFRSLEDQLPVPTRVPGVEDTVSADQPLFVRGDHRQPAELVPRRFLEAIDPAPFANVTRDAVTDESSVSGRLELAERLIDEQNPLTKRVIVNRLWHHVFGTGLVATPDNFGRMGQMPTHPELLDWLATRFAADGWSLKRSIRLMVTSATWQQTSEAAADAAAARAKDPDNQYLSSMSVRRLEGEAIRDALLAVSGTLDETSSGPPVSGGSNRRSVYVEVRRNALDPFLRAFDFPEPFSTVGRRDVTNVPAQSLTLMNDPRIEQLAQALAGRLAVMSSDNSSQAEVDAIHELYRRAFSRRPSESEIAQAQVLLKEVRGELTQLSQQATELRAAITFQQEAEAQILDPVRRQLLSKARSQKRKENGETANAKSPTRNAESSQSLVPPPVSAWSFEQDGRDDIGTAHLELRGKAVVRNGVLVVDGQKAHAVSAPLATNLREKTLVARVRLANLDQRGGGVISVQTPDGSVFDAIVFAEKDPQQWLAGSDGFARTSSLGGSPETEADRQPVHVAIVYHADGRIVGYRNGEPYGQPYQSTGPFEFKAGQAVVSFGVRHLPATGNRMLAGEILDAGLFDKALTPEQIQAVASGSEVFVSHAQVIAALTAEQKTQIGLAQEIIRNSEATLKSLNGVSENLTAEAINVAAWTELVRATFCFKEFVYLR